MSWAENEKLDEWIQRAYENGISKEQQRIINLLERTPFIWMGDVQLIQTSKDKLIELIKGEKND
jgi:hypothetical protein